MTDDERERLFADIVRHLSLGKTTYETARTLSTSPTNLSYRQRKYPEFQVKYKEALAEGKRIRDAARKANPAAKPPCGIPGCTRPINCRDMCKNHYNQWLVTRRKYAEPTPRIYGYCKGNVCEVPDCDRPMRSKGLCGPHYKQSLGSSVCPKCGGEKKGTSGVCQTCFNARRLERPPVKTCTVCRRQLTLDQFPWRKAPSGRTTPRERCRPCSNERARTAAAARSSVSGFKDKKDEATRARRDRLRKSEQDWLYYSLRASARRLKVDVATVIGCFDLVGNQCEACGEKCSIEPARRVQVDHCHQSGEFRGLLCGRCNMVAGQAQDDPDRLEKVARYLRERRSPAQDQAAQR